MFKCVSPKVVFFQLVGKTLVRTIWIFFDKFCFVKFPELLLAQKNRSQNILLVKKSTDVKIFFCLQIHILKIKEYTNKRRNRSHYESFRKTF